MIELFVERGGCSILDVMVLLVVSSLCVVELGRQLIISHLLCRRMIGLYDCSEVD